MAEDYKSRYEALYAAVVEAINMWESGSFSSLDVCHELRDLINEDNEHEF